MLTPHAAEKKVIDSDVEEQEQEILRNLEGVEDQTGCQKPACAHLPGQQPIPGQDDQEERGKDERREEQGSGFRDRS